MKLDSAIIDSLKRFAEREANQKLDVVIDTNALGYIEVSFYSLNPVTLSDLDPVHVDQLWNLRNPS